MHPGLSGLTLAIEKLGHVDFTMSYREYLGLPSTRYFFRSTYKHWYGKQLFAKTFWMHSKNSLESLNFVALTKPNKHKMRSEHFSTTWLNLFLNTFATVWVSGVADFFFFHSGVQIKKKYFHFQIHRLRVDGSRIWKEKVADRKIAGCV